jgi:ATP-dependent helicase/nuclease subunit A
VTRHPATERQVQAADPHASTWVSANAGSGKTRVLTDRVARLLLSGVSPAHILCLTYTKAAAAEMQNRLFRRLGDWAMKPDENLLAELADLGTNIALSDLPRARRLFAQAMEVPGGLRIQTIHAFCAGLLRRFPLECGVSPQFKEMDDRAAALLRAEVMDSLATAPETEALARIFTGSTLDDLLQDIAGRRDAFAASFDEQAVRRTLDLPPTFTEQDLIDSILDPANRADLARFVTLCAGGSTTDQKNADRLSRLGHTLADIETLESCFLFGETAANPFGAKIGSVPTKATRARDPDLCARIDDLMALVQDARPTRLALAALDRTRTLHAFARPYLAALDTAKTARGLVDFDDLIWRARALLTDPAVAQWVLFKLDGGIDHILVDEAQDTSPLQWEVIRALAQEFAAGEGAHPDRERTIFVVGDLKQSIYSFQGAEPEAFGQMQAHFAAELARIARGLTPLSLDYSFRSAQAVLRVVDLTFLAHPDGLGDRTPTHIAFHETLPGRVDLWDPIPPVTEDKDDRPWHEPMDITGQRHHTAILADRIATECARMIREETRPVTKDGHITRRPIRAGDILILVQRRSDLFSAIIRALKSQGLPVAGADRLRIGAELAVKDIGALLRFLALPEDDLALACGLRSPLLGWTEQQLYTLAKSRKSYLWEALRNSPHPNTLAILHDLRQQADFLRPYDLINRLLTRHDGRRRLLARLGSEAEDGIDALLAQALAYESTEIPSLTGFVEWMRTDDLDIKRQMDAAEDRIRVMTVHGAKGLEAPVVILPDTAKRKPSPGDALLPAGDHTHWPGPAASLPPLLQQARDDRQAAQDRERRRLLYVAMTRAESWLIVCAAGETGTGDESWHSMVHDGITAAGAVATDTGLHYALGDWTAPPLDATARAPQPQATAPTFGPVATPKPAAKPLSPSALPGAKVLPGESDPADQDAALARGSLIHLLLEHLPLIAPTQRESHARTLIQLSPDAALAGDPAPLIADAVAIVADPTFAPIFAADTLAEVDLTAPWGPHRLTGTIDRLIVRPTRVTAIDFKTNRLVPDKPEDTPLGILRQMGAYAAMLSVIWPDRTIDSAILWTARPVLMPLPTPLIMAALQETPFP